MRFLLALIVLISISNILEAQIYHFETGKVIPGDEPGLYSTQEGVFNSFPAEYSILLAFENRSKRNSRLLSLPIIRIKASDPDSSSYPIFLLHGGPGESNLKKDFLYDELVKYHDIVLVGYRGVDGRVKLDCPNVKEALLSEKLADENSKVYFSNALNNCISSLEDRGVDVNAYAISDVVADIHDVKMALGYDSISFLAFSFGTVLAQQFAYSYPNETENLLLVGARPVNHLTMDGDVLDRQLQKFVKYYLGDFNDSIHEASVELGYMNERIGNLAKIDQSISLSGLATYGFSQLYTLNGVSEFFNDAMDESYYDTLDILQSYNEFYEKYPGDVLLGDMYLKKKGKVICDSIYTADTSLGHLITQELNNWYSPAGDFLCDPQPALLDTLEHNALFISGELDVASPPELLEKVKPLFKNANFINLPQTGHLDFFFDQKPLMDSLIFDFYSK